MADKTDGRDVIVELTEKGRKLAERAMSDHAETERRLIAMLGRVMLGDH